MLSIDGALEIVSRRVAAIVSDQKTAPESVPLEQARGRVLREEIRADLDSPPFDRSIRDGFAVRAADLTGPETRLRIVGESRAGQSFGGVLGPGECAEIMTGAEVPSGADAVVMVEDTEKIAPDMVRIGKVVPAGRSIQTRGGECRRGDLVLGEGRTVGPAETAVLAATGHVAVRVSGRPSVAIVSTGDELVAVGEVPGPSQIRNSNSLTLAAQVEEAGGTPRMLGIVPDVVGALDDAVGKGLESDILITSGGVSMGKYDLVPGVLEGRGVEVAFSRVAMKPGKPTLFGWRGATLAFGLPGNPVSTIVAFQLFVRPVIRALLHADDAGSGTLEARLESPVRCDPARAACVPASVRFEDGGYRIAPVEWKGSSDLVGLARANAYVLIPCREGALEAGAPVGFIPMR